MHLVSVEPRLIFQALADATRIRILRLLAIAREETCLCELVDSLLEPQYNLSRHLKLLRQVGLLSAEKEGRFIYHRLVTEAAHLRALYAVILALPDTVGIFAADLRRFQARMRLRKSGRCRIGIQNSALAGTQTQTSSTKRFRAGRHR